jgi:catechol 2,3-dioxygenase-like lactoylglutathione lyase family enzyme
MSTVNVRYIVDDVDAAIGFYGDLLGFEVVMHPAPTFAILARCALRLLLSAPSERGGGGQMLPDGSRPEPGGWNRISLEVADVRGEIERLRAAGVRLRSELVEGVGGDQVLVMDPAGNLVELFQPHPR